MVTTAIAGFAPFRSGAPDRPAREFRLSRRAGMAHRPGALPPPRPEGFVLLGTAGRRDSTTLERGRISSGTRSRPVRRRGVKQVYAEATRTPNRGLELSTGPVVVHRSGIGGGVGAGHVGAWRDVVDAAERAERRQGRGLF